MCDKPQLDTVRTIIVTGSFPLNRNICANFKYFLLTICISIYVDSRVLIQIKCCFIFLSTSIRQISYINVSNSVGAIKMCTYEY